MGFVYVIRNGGLIKIGRTNDVERRMRELKPDEILSIHETNNSAKLEKELHSKFQSKRLPQSEYFRISAEEALRALGSTGDTFNKSKLLSINPGDKNYVSPLEKVKRKGAEALIYGSIYFVFLLALILLVRS